jgi:hypothetical protein
VSTVGPGGASRRGDANIPLARFVDLRMNLLVILGTALAAGLIVIAVAVVIAWLRRPPR